MLTAAVFNADLSTEGLGFRVSDFNSKMICSSCYGCLANSVVDAASKALCFALQDRINWRMNINIKTILSLCVELVKAVQQGSYSEACRLNRQIETIEELIAEMAILHCMLFH